MRIGMLISTLLCLFTFSSQTSIANDHEVVESALKYLPKNIVVHCDSRCKYFVFDDPEGIPTCVYRNRNVLVSGDKQFIFECNGDIGVSVCEFMALLYRNHVATKILMVGLSPFDSCLRHAILEKFIEEIENRICFIEDLWFWPILTKTAVRP